MTPRPFLAPILAAMLSAAIFVAPAHAAKLRVEDTIKSLEKKEIQLRPGRAIMESSNLARENYRTFLDLMSDDPELRAEAMRRLGDLELEATEAEQLADNIDALDYTVYDDTVTLYQKLLEAYPDYRRNDTVLYQLARAYEIGGQNDAALRVLDELVGKYPHTLLIDEVQFRRGEMLFLRRRYNDAERAYQDVVKLLPGSSLISPDDPDRNHDLFLDVPPSGKSHRRHLDQLEPVDV